MSKEIGSIFATKNPGHAEIKRSFAWHNVGHVLPHASKEISRSIDTHYGPRGGAVDWSQPEVGIVVDEPNERIRRHAEYLSATTGRQIQVYQPRDLQNGTHPSDSLIVPYIHTHNAEETIKNLGQKSWGLPPEMVAILKNKGSFHDLVRSTDGEFDVPDYVITGLSDFEYQTMRFLRQTTTMYDQYKSDMPEEYPLGIVIRGEESDGNYGNSQIRKKDGKIVVTSDGVANGAVDSWEQAISHAKQMLGQSVDRAYDPQFVISRFLDITDSPGLSVVIKDGSIYSLGWNGQIQPEGSTACVGTKTYKAETPNHEVDRLKYEDQSAETFTQLLRTTAERTGIPFDEINGVVNVDIMIPGPIEIALRKARGKKDRLYLAESNPRFTNYTDAVLAVAGFTQRTPSIDAMRDIKSEGIHSVDKMSLGGNSPEAVREELFILDEDAKKVGDPDRAFMRTPGDPGGFIFIGDHKRAQQKVETAKRKVTERTVFSLRQPKYK